MKTEQIGVPEAQSADPQRTHTAERIPSIDAASAGHGRAARDAGLRRVTAASAAGSLEDETTDAAAVSFARERERALARLDHTASIIRLRRALTVGLPVWVSAMLLDWLVTSVSHEGSLASFLWLRAGAALLVAGTIWRLWQQPEPSVPALWFYDILTFSAASASVSVLSLGFRGIESPYGPSVVLIMLARGATTLAPWQHGAWLFAAPALAYPITVAVAAFIDPAIAAQLEQPASRANLYILLFMIGVGWMMLVMGGHFAWRLRREAIETRNIGRYKLLRRLGSGGGGDVWAAIDTSLRQRVALKTVSGHRPGSQALARLEREVRALSELTHPNTVRVFDYGSTDDGLYYYAMELLQGENLNELVTREGPVASKRLSRLARQMLRALGEAHGKGIIHRDIKPENVFVAQMGGETGVVKLLDFGIAHTSGDSKLTRTGFVAGTPAYMAPETLTGSPADVRSDIYSFGATVYFALTGQPPLREGEPLTLLAAHARGAVRPLSELAPRPVAPALVRWVERCMAGDPRERFASTEDALDALNAIEAGD